LENLKHRECIQNEEGLDMSIIDNSQRYFTLPPTDPHQGVADKKEGSEREQEKEEMRMMFWNIRGLCKTSRRRQIKDFIMKEKLDGVGLQETIKSDYTQRELDDIAGGSLLNRFGRVPRGTQGASSWG
jgi:hypothetical protein